MKLLAHIKDATLFLLALVLVPTAVFVIYAKGSFLLVASKSMEPSIKAGDTVLTRLIPTYQIHPKDIVVLPVPDNPKFKYSHRVISAKYLYNGTIIKTKGDANPNPDAWSTQITSEQVSKVIAVFSTSSLLNGPINRRGIFFILLIIGASLFAVGLWRSLRAQN